MTTIADRPGIPLPSLRQDWQSVVIPTATWQDQPEDQSTRARRPFTAEILTELSLFALVLTAALGIARLMQGGLGHQMVLPVLASIAAGSAVTTAAARRNFNLAAVAAFGILAMALVTMWSVFPSATTFGLPTPRTFHVIVNAIQTARAVMGSHRTPIPLVPGIVLIVSIVSGAASVVARTLWEFRRRCVPHWPRLLAVLPTLGMFCYAAPLSARIDRPQITILYLSSALVFIAASDSAGASLHPVGRFRRPRAVLATVLPTAATAATALLVLLLAAAALGGTTPLPFPWWSSQAALGGYDAPGGQRGSGVTSLSLIADLRGTETSESTVQMFVAQTPVPTYWQVGLLDVFNGSSFVPGALETAAINGQTPTSEPITPTLPFQALEFGAKVTLDHYSGRLLPAPPLAQSVGSDNGSIASATVYDGLGISVDTPAGAGTSYSVTAAQVTAPPLSASPTFAGIDAGLGDAASEYLHLPNGIPAEVKAIAKAETAGTNTPLEEVQALLNFFHGDSFIYTLDPPTIPPNVNPLMAFLSDHEGFCQQFATAFGVLARELGIPVRIAAGFTAGHQLGNTGDTYAIDGQDAHVWPEVYMGPSIGWLSVDPTPGGPQVDEKTVPSVMSKSQVIGGGFQGSKGPPKTGKNKITKPTAPKGGRVAAPSIHPASVHHSAPLPAGTIFGAVLAALAVVGAVLFFRRSRRSVRPRSGGRLSGDPDSVVIRSWMRAADALGRAGFRRSQWTTPISHAHEIRDAVTGATAATGKRAEATAALGTATFGYIELAEMAEVACYSPGHCSSRDAHHAEQEAWRIERALRSAGLFRRFPSQYNPLGQTPA